VVCGPVKLGNLLVQIGTGPRSESLVWFHQAKMQAMLGSESVDAQKG